MRDYKNYYNGEFSNYDGADSEYFIPQETIVAAIDDNNVSNETTYSSSKIEELVSAGGGSIPVIDKTSDSGNTFSIEPNKMYMFGEREVLNITFVSGDSNIVNEYMFQFTSGNVATALYVPDTVVWMKDLNTQTNKKYLVSIENNLGVIGEWDNE
jgi:hypothetical protein